MAKRAIKKRKPKKKPISFKHEVFQFEVLDVIAHLCYVPAHSRAVFVSAGLLPVRVKVPDLLFACLRAHVNNKGPHEVCVATIDRPLTKDTKIADFFQAKVRPIAGPNHDYGAVCLGTAEDEVHTGNMDPIDAYFLTRFDSVPRFNTYATSGIIEWVEAVASR